jgi:hypothetical protein
MTFITFEIFVGFEKLYGGETGGKETTGET